MTKNDSLPPVAEVVPLAGLTPDSKNANKHTERGTYMLRRSIERFGFLEPGVLDVAGRVIGGNNRLEAAADVLDASDAIVIDTDGTRPIFVRRSDLDLTTPEGREAAIALNRTAQVGIEFDPDVLNAVLADGVDLGDWFKTDELIGLGLDVGQPQAGDAEPQIDRADELREKWGVEVGQLWRLPSRTPGREHRLICGDCTDAAVAGRVMGGEGISLILTDPPYNIGYSYDVYDDNKDLVSWKRAVNGWYSSLTSIGAPMIITPGRQNLFVWGQLGDPDVAAWVKANAHGGARIAHFAKYEPILFYGKHTRRRDSDVFEHHVDNGFLNDAAAIGHVCPKPLRLWDDLLSNYSNTGSVIYDPFSGSGTTIVSAENLGRQCRAVELSPGYVAVALERYATAFGIEPELADTSPDGA